LTLQFSYIDFSGLSLATRSNRSKNRAGGKLMSWNAPKVTEVALGAEINSYVCGERK